MTDEMLELARANQRQAGVENVEFLKGTIENVPLPDDSVDVVISNCVINLSGDKPEVFREAARVLRPGGRFAVSDVVADPDMDEATRRDMQQWTGCIAGALTREEFERELADGGFETSRSSRPTGSTTRPRRRSSGRHCRSLAAQRQRRARLGVGAKLVRSIGTDRVGGELEHPAQELRVVDRAGVDAQSGAPQDPDEPLGEQEVLDRDPRTPVRRAQEASASGA